MAGSSALWGLIASSTGVATALILASAGLGLGLLTAIKYRLTAGEKLDLTPSMHWPVPILADEEQREHGPVRVTVEYRIDPAKRLEFLHVIQRMEDIRRRDGAVQWELQPDSADPTQYVETFVVESWLEHLRQHERVTITDRDVETQVRKYHLGPNPPVVTHVVQAPEADFLREVHHGYH
jgi:quinol monooxygenase YgiN